MLIQKSKNENLAKKLWNLGKGNFTFTTSLGEVTINTDSYEEYNGTYKTSKIELNGKKLIVFKDLSSSEYYPDKRAEKIYSEDEKYEITITNKFNRLIIELVSKQNPDDIINITIDNSKVSMDTGKDYDLRYDGEPKDNEFILYKLIRGIETIGYNLMNNDIIIPFQTNLNLKFNKISIPSDKNVVEEIKELQNKINNLNSTISSTKYLDNLEDFNIGFQFEENLNINNLEKHVNDLKNMVNIYREYSNIFSKVENQPIFREIEEKVDLLIEKNQENNIKEEIVRLKRRLKELEG